MSHFFPYRVPTPYLADDPAAATYPGDLPGLLAHCDTWHRAEQQGRYRQVYAWPGDTATAQPTIPLPADPAIRWLDTVDALIAEGATMHHCVGSYVPLAVQGRGYFFHIDHAGTAATAQLTPQGTLVQVHGPGNRPNAAAAYGAQVLARWGAALAATPQPPRCDPRVTTGAPGPAPTLPVPAPPAPPPGWPWTLLTARPRLLPAPDPTRYTYQPWATVRWVGPPPTLVPIGAEGDLPF